MSGQASGTPGTAGLPGLPGPRVGFIGIGMQGGPMARRIAGSGLPTTLWARRPGALEAFADTPAATAASAAELGAASDVVGVCVVDDAGVEEVVAGPDGVLAGMAAGGVVAVHATVHPDTCRRLAARAAETGVALVDAPVSGTGRAASEGTLLVMAGGEPDDVDRCRPVFGTFSDRVLHLGPVGAGQVAKVLNNLLFAANLAAAASVYAAARELDVDPATLAQVVANGSGESFASGVMAGIGFDLAVLSGHAGPLLRKDVTFFAELAGAAGARGGAALAAADSALAALDHPRVPGARDGAR